MLDFYGGSHGHFLEYVVNTYIFDASRVEDPFDKTGASHNKNQDYANSRNVVAGHFTEYNLNPEFQFDQVIRIDFDSIDERIIYLINVLHRAGGISKEEKESKVEEFKNYSPCQYRIDYYSKFKYRDLGHVVPDNWKFQDKKSFTVKMFDLYDYVNFCRLMQNLANFLNMTFKPEVSLFQLWKKFMDLNQGYNIWHTCKNIFCQMSANDNTIIDIDTEHQAVLNFLISDCYNVYTGQMFDSDEYPNNTHKLWEIVKKEIQSFDQRFPD